MHIAPLLLALILISPVSVSAASIYLDPDSGTYGPGDTFILNVRLNTDGECINAANVEIKYPATSMRAVDFGKGGSILSLWVTEPTLDTSNGSVTFAGGIPGGYCGRIQGDPALTNIIGKVVFTVTNATAENAVIRLTSASELYLNDGMGTKISPEVTNATIKLVPQATLSENPWLSQVGEDKIPPDAFDVLIESTRSVFGGRYYAVFATVDKQSGVDHYEMVINGAWQRASSPHVVSDQSLENGVEVRAIDKAGNIRLGTYVKGSAPPRAGGPEDYAAVILIAVLLIAALLARRYLNASKATDTIDLRL